MSQFFSELPWPFLIMLHFYPVTSLVAQRFASIALQDSISAAHSGPVAPPPFFLKGKGSGERGLIS